MKDELWLKKIKDRLDDYSEPIPVGGWERLEKDLSKSLTPIPISKRVPFYRRWSVAAAAVLLLAISSISIWLLQSPVAQDIQQVASVVEMLPKSDLPVSSPIVATSDRESTLAQNEVVTPRVGEGRKADFRTNGEVVVIDTAVDAADDKVSEMIESVVQDKAPQENEKVQSETNVDTDSSRRRVVYRPSGKEKFHLPVEDKSSSSERWSVALAVANTGGLFSLGSTSGNMMLHTAGSPLSSDGVFDLSATSNGIFNIPEGQQLEFRDGIPYLSGKNKEIASIDHKQPVSVGFSVRKCLMNGFSLETGLSYTFLASDVTTKGGEEWKQKLHYLGIPLRANWSFLNRDRFELYVSAGGAVEKCIYGKLGSEDQTVRPFQFSVMGAVGAQLNVSRRVGIYVEPGVSYYFNDGSRVETIRKENPCNFTLQGGIRLSY